MGIRAGATGLVGLLACTLGACAAADDGAYDIDVEFRDEGVGGTEVPTRPDRPGGGGWISNGLHNVNVSGINTNYGLSTPEGMAETGDLLAIDDRRGTAEYLVECALAEGQSITKVVGDEVLVFEGQLGLAPQWHSGACDSDCQQWVSACLLARTNTSGQEVDIWITGDHPNIGLGRSWEFPFYEASFYGNLFEDGDAQYLCRGSKKGIKAALAAGRTCSGPKATCGITTYGLCGAKNRCDRVDGYDVACAAGAPPSGEAYHSISTYVRAPSIWGSADAVSVDEAP